MIREEKAALRRIIREGRRRLQPGYPQAAGKAAACLLTSSSLWQRNTVMAYAAVRGEMDITPILEAALAGGKTLLMPRCEGAALVPRCIASLEELSPRTMGIPEPLDSCPTVDPGTMGMILVPGLSYDRRGLRLGQGGGYYDRFLPESGMLRIGVCYAHEVLEYVPAEPFDERVDYILTEDALVCVKGEV